MNSLFGNESVKKQLKNLLNKRKVGSSLLFFGQEGVGKSLFAYEFASMIMCEEDSTGSHELKMKSKNHPDVHVYMPEGKVGMHSIRSMRHFSKEAQMPPYEGKWKIFIIHDAEKMMSVSANSLLKTFEEPSLQTFILLISSFPEAILPTILSRCRKVRFSPISKEGIEKFLIEKRQVDSREAKDLALEARGSIGVAVRLLKEREGEKKNSLLLEAFAKGNFPSCFLSSRIIQGLNEEIENMKKELEDDLWSQYSSEFPDMTAVQRESVEKDIEGSIALKLASKMEKTFSTILSWYRDLNLLKEGVDSKYLINKRWEESLLSAANSSIPPLEDVQRFIGESRLAVQRSIKFSVCLEDLFLKLHLL